MCTQHTPTRDRVRDGVCTQHTPTRDRVRDSVCTQHAPTRDRVRDSVCTQHTPTRDRVRDSVCIFVSYGRFCVLVILPCSLSVYLCARPVDSPSSGSERGERVLDCDILVEPGLLGLQRVEGTTVSLQQFIYLSRQVN